QEVADDINNRHENSRYHPGIELPESIVATPDPASALADAPVVVLAVPSQTLRSNLLDWGSRVAPDALVVSLLKGIELGTMSRMTEVAAQVVGGDSDRVAVVSGPNLAREIAQRQPAATTVACVDPDRAQQLADLCTASYFRPYWTTDVVGTELGGAVKNVIALANGMLVGLGMGENAQASLITRGLAEMSRLGEALGANPLTFLGLAGMGDLVATCSSPLSRNRSFGELLGQGLTTDEASARMTQTCEGVKSCQPILELARANGVDMPITEHVVQVVHADLEPRDAVVRLMSRATRSEAGTG
ncbi:MAG TPA: NAD(P)H-dependent glycerol-3-phosphate dehydrogenase, partial [Candidatus Nanopelagicales bacterium]|nr:NAD(P)H-dependent glycerol-3-phosphate dehydrogenase [Candidatus Nanopelagicales bacterium]